MIMVNGSFHWMRERVTYLVIWKPFLGLLHKKTGFNFWKVKSEECRDRSYRCSLLSYWGVGCSIGNANWYCQRENKALEKPCWSCWKEQLLAFLAERKVSTKMSILKPKSFKGTRSAKDLEFYYYYYLLLLFFCMRAVFQGISRWWKFDYHLHVSCRGCQVVVVLLEDLGAKESIPYRKLYLFGQRYDIFRILVNTGVPFWVYRYFLQFYIIYKVLFLIT